MDLDLIKKVIIEILWQLKISLAKEEIIIQKINDFQ